MHVTNNTNTTATFPYVTTATKLLLQLQKLVRLRVLR
jgi:hypothetical protein